MKRPWCGRPSTSPGLWAWTLQARRLSMRAWTTARGWPSVFRPQAPSVAITVRRFGKRAFTAADLVEQGALPENVRAEAGRVLHSRRNILVSGGTGSGKTTLLNALIELLPEDERIVAIEDTLELRIERLQLRPIRGARVARKGR